MSARKSRKGHSLRITAAGWCAVQIESLRVVQCAQTYVFATYTMRRSEEMRWPLQRSVQLPLTIDVQHNGNRIDCSCGAVFARWRGLGILSLARMSRSPVRSRNLETSRASQCSRNRRTRAARQESSVGTRETRSREEKAGLDVSSIASGRHS